MNHRNTLARAALGLALLGSALGASSAWAAPVAVDLRVEGVKGTIFEDRITTDGHAVTTASGGTHTCDGTNGGVNPTPGPSATAALDDAAKRGGFTWDGTYSDGFDDYLISRIGPESQTDTLFWGLLVNSQFSSVGGCQQRVRQGDEVLWALDGFGKIPLRLAGPTAAVTGRAFGVRVTDGSNGTPVAGANVRGRLTNSAGRTSVTLASRGLFRIKATRANSIRSNALEVCVDPPGAAPCSSFDRLPPSVDLDLPGLIASTGSRSRRIRLSWAGQDPAGGSGVTAYDVEVRRVARGVGRGGALGWRPLLSDTQLTSTLFRGAAGGSYQFRVVAIDRARNRGEGVVGGAIIPVDDRDRRWLKRSKGDWRLLKRKRAFRKRVLRSKRKGAVAKLRWRGRGVALIGRKLRNGGRLRVTIDGRSRVIDLEGKPRFRQVLFISTPRKRGRHRLRLKAVGGGPVEIDAIAPLP